MTDTGIWSWNLSQREQLALAITICLLSDNPHQPAALVASRAVELVDALNAALSDNGEGEAS